jgi:dipeptidase
MCDTLVVLPEATADGSVLFAKNSDREPNEAHHLLLIPAADHPIGEQVACTYISIPQVNHTHAVLLAKPFWIWGAEMGANEHGVVIGNEAVFTHVPYEKTPGLIGMDLLRLALERAGDALSALKVITELLETHGQGGNCGLTHPFYYHNSFLVADPQQAWILETAGRQWAARQVKQAGSISNAITIGAEWDFASADLVSFALDQGWHHNGEQFNFSRCYSDFLYTRFSDAASRQSCTLNALRAKDGKATASDMMRILRSHRSTDPSWSPGPAITGADVCMHAGWGPVRGSQTTGSMVSHLKGDCFTHWVTATSAPCISVFKPVWMDCPLPDTGPIPGPVYNPDSLWWRHERFHRQVLHNYPQRIKSIASEIDRLESEFIADSREINGANSGKYGFSQRCFQQARQAEEEWEKRIQSIPPRSGWWFYYNLAWKNISQSAGLYE